MARAFTLRSVWTTKCTNCLHFICPPSSSLPPLGSASGFLLACPLRRRCAWRLAANHGVIVAYKLDRVDVTFCPPVTLPVFFHSLGTKTLRLSVVLPLERLVGRQNSLPPPF
ncbi:hypothetical protein AFLA_003012 [Aspergillus flavus NRRL3357]|nr:hypothetical protein AFLA_003012 [Aspergillus flavus NRRL3357]